MCAPSRCRHSLSTLSSIDVTDRNAKTHGFALLVINAQGVQARVEVSVVATAHL